MKKLLVITDMDSNGSGYRNICAPLFTEISKLGEYDTKIVGLMYKGEEHNYPFSIIPARDVQEMVGISRNVIGMWWADVIIVAMDIPLQINLYNQLAPFLQRTKPEVDAGFPVARKYIAITPLENGPLTMSWAIPLFQMDKVFFISELGKREAEKRGLKNVEHIQVGVDTVSYHPATPEEKVKLRDGLGIPQDAFVVLTVADNQERKNLWAGLKAIALLKGEVERPVRYILVTREQNPYGWRLKDLIKDLDIQQEVILFERGMPVADLWGLYAVSDAYLQPSKAEGLGMPVLDAMASGIPVVATKVGAMTELLEDGRGFLIDGEYEFGDVWGNSNRVMISIDGVRRVLSSISTGEDWQGIRTKALLYARSRTWDIPAKQLDTAIKELLK
jgi:glycosyltransferase involved in cell wall biosynthesis